MYTVSYKQRDFSIPELFRDLITHDSGFSYVDLNGKESTGKIIKSLKSEKFIVIINSLPEKTHKLYKEIIKRLDEILPFDKKTDIRSKNFSRNRKREYDKLKNNILNRLLIVAQGYIITSFSKDVRIPYLDSFCGENPNCNDPSKEYLIPYKFFLELKESLNSEIFIKCANLKISAGINVLLPKSQETTELFKSVFSELPKKNNLVILDMGCGSGVLTLIADSLFEDSEIHFTDILPEALASALNNIDNNISPDDSSNSLICRDPGDLFEKIDDVYDLIIFNPPWVDAPARNRSEFALNDRDQKLLERFIIQAKNRLKPDGRIALAYSDNNGDKAVEKFNSIVLHNGFITEKEYSAKVQSYQSGRKWMRIFVRILKQGKDI